MSINMKPNNAINSDHKKLRYAPLFVSGYGWRWMLNDSQMKTIKALLIKLFFRLKWYVLDRWPFGILRTIIKTIAIALWGIVTFYAYKHRVHEGSLIFHFLIAAIVFQVIDRLFPLLEALLGKRNNDLKLMRRNLTSAHINRINRYILAGCVTKDDFKDLVSGILDCIAMSVQETRCDHQRVKIHANLVVEKDEDKYSIIARTDKSRYKREYDKGKCLCSDVFDTKKPKSWGNVLISSKRWHERVPYKSFMALPVLDLEASKCLAVVTVDSKEYHHFDGVHENYYELLKPYLETLSLIYYVYQKYGEKGAGGSQWPI